MTVPKTILIMAAGTGGHVIPALQIARLLQQDPELRVIWLGTDKGIETKLVPEAGIPLHKIDMAGVRRKGLLRWLSAPWQIWQAIKQVQTLLRKEDVKLVLGMGGYITVPGGLAAYRNKIPLIIHEQNSRAGLSNRLLACFARQVLQAFPHTFSRKNATTVGNPVRDSIRELPAPDERLSHRPKNTSPHLLVLGGSLGASRLNSLIPEALSLIAANERPVIWHQCGPEHQAATEQQYQALGIKAKITPFIDNMAEAYAFADCVIARAGALTVSEIAAAGVASLLIPYPHAVDDHQTKNAEALVTVEAAQLLPQATLTPEKLASALLSLGSPTNCLSRALAAREIPIYSSGDNIVHFCMEALHG